ncbi:hypothetical protein Sjap_004660 [Stephania japonica]|uniref:Uncharacterized protein n=1 Tax=Stephania japonica TaxID=461633 RepID=A0AAP0PI05_9MAGN
MRVCVFSHQYSHQFSFHHFVIHHWLLSSVLSCSGHCTKDQCCKNFQLQIDKSTMLINDIASPNNTNKPSN